MDREAKRQMDEPLTSEEVLNAIMKMKSGKTAGPDGIPIDIYKTFKDKLAIPLLEMYKESLLEGFPSLSLRDALITLIPKLDKPQDRCESYKAIYLMNSDAKLIAKVLALRLEDNIPCLIGIDQNGFVRNRQALHNIM